MTLTCSSHFNILLFFFFFLFFPLVVFSSEFAQHSTQLSPSSSLSSQWWTQESSPAEISSFLFMRLTQPCSRNNWEAWSEPTVLVMITNAFRAGDIWALPRACLTPFHARWVSTVTAIAVWRQAWEQTNWVLWTCQWICWDKGQPKWGLHQNLKTDGLLKVKSTLNNENMTGDLRFFILLLFNKPNTVSVWLNYMIFLGL